MADLYNLLNDLTENQNDEEENVVPDVNITEDTNDNTNNDGVLDPALTNDNSNNEYRDSQYDWNSSNNNDNDINLPPALREAAIQKQKQESDDRYYDDDNDIDSPTTKKTDKTDDTSMMLLSNDTLYDDTNKDLYHMMTTMQEQSSDLRYTHLRNWWIQELNSPELLQYDEELILDAIHAIETQNECIDNVSNNDTDDDEQEQNYILHTGNKNLDAMLISLIRIDLERMKFILCDLLKIRLNKIEKYPLHHILEIDMRDRMSTQELTFLKEYGITMEKHLNRTVLNYIQQDAFKQINESNMIDQPNLDQYVFIKSISDEVQIGDSQLNQNDFFIVRYNQIRNHYNRGEVEMLL